MTKIVAFVSFILGAATGAITLHFVAPDPIAQMRADQAPVRAQADRDIDSMKRELQRHQQAGASSSWH